jgi:hypothetical protein
MSFQCPNCREYRVLADRCNCQRFEASVPWRGHVEESSWTEVWAYDADDAAEKHAQTRDSEGEYSILRNGSTEIWVRDADGAITRWHIEAESVPTYRASAIKECAGANSPSPETN